MSDRMVESTPNEFFGVGRPNERNFHVACYAPRRASTSDAMTNSGVKGRVVHSAVVSSPWVIDVLYDVFGWDLECHPLFAMNGYSDMLPEVADTYRDKFRQDIGDHSDWYLDEVRAEGDIGDNCAGEWDTIANRMRIVFRHGETGECIFVDIWTNDMLTFSQYAVRRVVLPA